jgi:Predicted exporters of the RND superfamily
MKLARFISHHSKEILILALVLAIPAAIGYFATPINYDILSYLPQNLGSTKGEVLLDKGYGDASTGILIIEGKKTNEILELKDRLAAIEGVRNVIWTSDVIDPTVPPEMLPAQAREGFYSANNTRMIIRFWESSTSERTMAAIDEIRKAGGKGTYLSGASPIIKDTKDLADRETPLYVILAVIFSVVVLALTMESPLIPIIFLAEIGLAVLYNLGSNILLGQISYLTKALAAVLQLGVTMDFSIFLLNRYDEERKKFEDHREAMAEAINKTFLTISGGALTEVAGFMALCTMDLRLGADIGVVMSKGVVFGLLGTMTILPAMLLFFDKPIHKLNHRPLLPSFKKTAGFVSKHNVVLSILFVVLLVPAFYGQTHTKQYYNLIDSLPSDMASVEATNKLKTDYNMVTTHFLLVRDDLAPADTRDIIEQVERLPGVTSVLAYEKFAGPLLPDSVIPDSIRGIFRQGGKNLIMVNSEYKASTNELNDQLESIDKIIQPYDSSALVTGEGALTKDLIRIAASDFKRVDIVSIGAVFVIILLILKSLSLPFLLVGGIELAILINMAWPFFVGETIPFIASIVIGCVQLGVTIDYAILLVTRYREEIQSGKNKHEAMNIAIASSARSIVTSALTLFAATAGVSVVSKIAMLQCLCNMIARGALISMVIIIFILPATLVLFEGVVERTTLNWRKPPKPRFARVKEIVRK